MPTITETRHITDEQYIGHQLAKLASCRAVLPWSVVSSVASNIIGDRFDRKEWIEKFTDKCKEHQNDTE